jgi:hypothetical protein
LTALTNPLNFLTQFIPEVRRATVPHDLSVCRKQREGKMSSIQPIHLDTELLTNTLSRYHQDLRRLRRNVIAAIARAEAAQILAEELEANLMALVELLGGPEGGQAGTSIALGLGSRVRIEPAPIARSLEKFPRTDGFLDIRIDCSEDTVTLSPLLGSLFVFLAEGPNSDPRESVVGWRTRDEILAHLQSLSRKEENSPSKDTVIQTGKEDDPKIPPSRVSKLIYLLREKLGPYGRLVESNRQKGWRFSLRRRDAGNLVQTRLAGGGKPAAAQKRAKPWSGPRFVASPAGSD